MSTKHVVSMNYCENCNLPYIACEELPDCSQLTETHYRWVERATWEEMKTRSNPIKQGDSIFLGKMGDFFLKRMTEKSKHARS